MSFREIIKQKHSMNTKATLIQKQKIHYFFDMASSEFKLEAQRILNHHQPKIINVIKFDELLDECSD